MSYLADLWAFLSRAVRANVRASKPHFDPQRDIADLTGKVFLVTGAAGIGGETARVLLSKNATVYVAGRNRAKSESAIEAIKKSTGKQSCHFLQVDLADLKSVKAGAETFLAQADRLDVLILNAGVMACPPAMRTEQGYDMQFGTNVLGHHYLLSCVRP